MKKNIFILALFSILSVSCIHANESSERGIAVSDSRVTLNQTDKETVLKMILSHPDLQMFLHPEVAGRIPVKVMGDSQFNNDLQIVMFGEQVQFVAPGVDTEAVPVWEIVDFTRSGNGVFRFMLRYAIEGVRVEGAIKRSGSSWQFTEFRVSET